MPRSVVHTARLAAGRCLHCGARPCADGDRYCLPCRERQRASNRRYYRRHRAAILRRRRKPFCKYCGRSRTPHPQMCRCFPRPKKETA